MLAFQNSGFRELPPPPGSKETTASMPFKSESVIMLKKMLADSLRSLNMFNSRMDQSTIRSRQLLMGAPPMLENGPAMPPSEEEIKAMKEPRREHALNHKEAEEIKELKDTCQTAIPAHWYQETTTQPQATESKPIAQETHEEAEEMNEFGQAMKYYGNQSGYASPNPLLASPALSNQLLLSPMGAYPSDPPLPTYYPQMEPLSLSREPSEYHDMFHNSSPAPESLFDSIVQHNEDSSAEKKSDKKPTSQTIKPNN